MATCEMDAPQLAASGQWDGMKAPFYSVVTGHPGHYKLNCFMKSSAYAVFSEREQKPVVTDIFEVIMELLIDLRWLPVACSVC